jgi:hypothetical protein
MPDEDQLSLRQADQIRGDLYGIQDDLDFIKVQLARLPIRLIVAGGSGGDEADALGKGRSASDPASTRRPLKWRTVIGGAASN